MAVSQGAGSLLMTDSKDKTTGNEILAALSSPEYERIALNLEPVSLIRGRVLYNFGDRIRHVYFPVSGMVSLLSVTGSGQVIEVGLAGKEAMVGIPVILGQDIMPYQVVVQVQGTAMRMKAALLKEEFSRRRLLHDLILGYIIPCSRNSPSPRSAIAFTPLKSGCPGAY
jgi:CRP-like cAMP-binding protein